MSTLTGEVLQATTGKNSVSEKTSGSIIQANEVIDSSTEKHDQKITSPDHVDAVIHIGASTTADEEKSAEKVEEDCKAKGKVIQEFASSVILFGLAELLSVTFLPENSVDVNKQIVEAIAAIGFVTLISGLASLFHTFFMQAHSKTCRNPIHHAISKGLTLVSGVDLVFASVLPVVLLPKPYKFLIPPVSIVVLLALGSHLYLRYRSVTDETKSDERDQSKEEELTKKTTRLSELSQVVFSLSSGGLLGLLFGIQKNASNHAHHPVVVVAVFLIFAAFICSSMLIILCQTQLKHLSSSARETILKIGFGLCTFLLVLLAAAALAITYTFLQLYTLVVPVPASVVFIFWIGSKLCSGNIKQDDLGEEQLNWAYTMGNKVTSVSFSGIMIIFSCYLGSSSSSEKNMHLNISMVFMASAFISGLMLMLTSCKPSISRMGIVVSIQTYYASTLLVFGVSTVFILEFVQLFVTTSKVCNCK